jgi:hypothetical protein
VDGFTTLALGTMWTWQDPAALAAAALGLALAWWLQRRFGAKRGCGGCPAKELHQARRR